MKYIVLPLLSLFFFCSPLWAGKAELMDATVKITVYKPYVDEKTKEKKEGWFTGTAFAYLKVDGKVLFMTAGHVLDDARFAYIKYGDRRIIADKEFAVYDKNTLNDFGIISTDAKDYGDKTPHTVLMLPPNKIIKKDAKVIIYGFPKGVAKEVSTEIKDSFTDYLVTKQDNIVGGTSGSPVYVEQDDCVIGILILEDSTSISVSKIWELTGWERPKD